MTPSAGSISSRQRNNAGVMRNVQQRSARQDYAVLSTCRRLYPVIDRMAMCADTVCDRLACRRQPHGVDVVHTRDVLMRVVGDRCRQRVRCCTVSKNYCSLAVGFVSDTTRASPREKPMIRDETQTLCPRFIGTARPAMMPGFGHPRHCFRKPPLLLAR